MKTWLLILSILCTAASYGAAHHENDNKAVTKMWKRKTENSKSKVSTGGCERRCIKPVNRRPSDFKAIQPVYLPGLTTGVFTRISASII
ncbi:MAG TPA: hypothetical protein VM802_30200 [Chitinophaga sp.]|uniref:hypothetical protein n=1 Tax=Chitinophaga sp. TaxID=1869181 RepID=UPI002BE5C7F6|nr:hypothetical protein [Chitinophaga sp.]HVI49178.1 hypothetical protein [Chitinophaga sp.]